MTKILTGAAITYGSTLPSNSAITDGTLFFLTTAYTDAANSPTNPTPSPIARTPGLHIYNFRQDLNSLLSGDQVGFGWQQLSTFETFVKTSGDTMTGPLYLVNNANLNLSGVSPSIRFTETDEALNAKDWLLVADGAHFQIQTRDESFASAYTAFAVNRFGAGTLNGATIWTAGNDGAGSGLDADVLDGQHGTYYLDTLNHVGTIPVSRGGTGNTIVAAGGVLYGASTAQYASVVGTAGQLLSSNGAAAPTWVNASSLSSGYAAQAGSLTPGASINLTGGVSGSAVFTGAAATNISVTVNNLQGYVTSAAQSPLTVVLRDSSGHVYANYLNQASPSNEVSSGSIDQIMVTTGSDTFLRKASIAQLQAAIGVSGYVAKTGDTMSGSLTLTTGGTAVVVNGISLNHTNSLISTTGAISAGTTIVAGSTISASGSITAAGGGGGLARAILQPGGGGFTGAIDFHSVIGREGYIGRSSSTSSADGGTINYVAGNHSYFGTLTSNNIIQTASNMIVLNGVFKGGTSVYGGSQANPMYSFEPWSGTGGASNGLYMPGANEVRMVVAGSNVMSWTLSSTTIVGSLTATGNITAYSGVFITSDRRLKENIAPIQNALQKVQAITGVTYDRVDHLGPRQTGVIAQDVQAVLPEAVHEMENGKLSVAYGNMIGLLVEAIKEQQAQIETLREQIRLLAS